MSLIIRGLRLVNQKNIKINENESKKILKYCKNLEKIIDLKNKKLISEKEFNILKEKIKI